MANITLTGTLLDPNSDLAVGDEIRFTHASTTGQTIKGAISLVTIGPAGTYSVALQYGLVLVEYKDIRSTQFKNLGVATVNATNTATSIPELLNALVPVSSAELIEFQAILADAVTAKNASEAAAATTATRVDTFANLILLTPTIDGSTFVCQERVSAEYILQAAGYTALAGDSTFANSRVAQLQTGADTTVFSFGAVADYNAATFTGTDNTAAFTNFKIRAALDGLIYKASGGDFYFDGGQLIFDEPVEIVGAGEEVTNWYFGGSPTKTQELYVTWRSEYDSGDYTNSADANIAVAVKLDHKFAHICGVTITTATQYAGYSTPWNSLTDAPTSNYDIGLLINWSNCSVEYVEVFGVWSQYGTALNGTANTFGDGFTSNTLHSSGRYGLGILGAEGQPNGGVNFLPLAAGDTRTNSGMSDLDFHRGEFYSTFSPLKSRLRIDGVNKRVRGYASNAGAFYINGQAGNTIGKIQGHRFWNTRFSGCEIYTGYINYSNRDEFFGCHWDTNNDAIGINGEELGPGDFSYETTANTSNAQYHAGELGGSVDNRTKTGSDGSSLFSEFGFRTPESLGFAGFKTDILTDNGTFTPTLVGTSGVVTYGASFARWVKIGNLVKIWVRITVATVNTVSGTLTVPIPFTASSTVNLTYPASFGVVQNVALIDGIAGSVDDGASFVSLFRHQENGNVNILNQSDIADGSRIDFTIDILV
jgi:hypothetical protein